jgi:hypothetical protein
MKHTEASARANGHQTPETVPYKYYATMVKHRDTLAERNAVLLAALRDISDADYGTDTPKLRERARAAIAQAS